MRRLPPAPIAWLAALLAIYLVAPFIAGALQLGSADWRTVDWSGLGQACTVSVISASLATLCVSLCGVPLGYLLARFPTRSTSLLGFVVQLPLALPPLASGILLLFLLGYASPVGRWTGGALTDSLAGIVLAEAFVSAPFLIIAARSAFAGMDPVLEDVAATLGHRPLAVFLRVSLPLAWRSIIAGMLLAWLRSFGEFGATVLVAYHPYSLPVYTYVAFGSQGLPAMLPVLLPTLGAALVVMIAGALIPGAPVRRPRRSRANRTSTRNPTRSAPCDAAQAEPIAFAFHRQLDGFLLNTAWTTNARRLAVLGASGSGKSMMLRLIAGLDRVPGGRLTLAGRDLSALPPDRRGIAYVPQNYGLFPHLDVRQQLSFAIDSDAARAAAWIDRLGLTGLEGRLPRELSLGQQQRVALARAFSRPTALLLLDEPFSALDAPLRVRLRQELRTLQADIAATTILVTHDPDEAFLLADELMILDDGHVLQIGPREAVFARPNNETVARLLGAQNVGYGRVVWGGGIDVGDGVVLAVAGPALPPGVCVGWSVRPDRIRICGGGPYHGVLVGITPPIAGRRDVQLRLGDCVMHAAIDPGEPCEPGPCRVMIDPACMQVWPLSAKPEAAAASN